MRSSRARREAIFDLPASDCENGRICVGSGNRHHQPQPPQPPPDPPEPPVPPLPLEPPEEPDPELVLPEEPELELPLPEEPDPEPLEDVAVELLAQAEVFVEVVTELP